MVNLDTLRALRRHTLSLAMVAGCGCSRFAPLDSNSSAAAEPHDASPSPSHVPPSRPAPLEPSNPDVTETADAQAELDTLAAIRVAVERYFAQPTAVVDAELGPDVKALVPLEVGRPVRSDGRLSLPPWDVKLEGDHATLTYAHPSMIYTNWRSWFSLQVIRNGDVWSVPSAGLGTGIACALRTNTSSGEAQPEPESEEE